MPSLSTKMHFLKHTEIYVLSEMIAYAPQDIFQTLPVPVRLCIYKKLLPDMGCIWENRIKINFDPASLSSLKPVTQT